MTNKAILTLTAITAFIATTAFAADMPVKVAPRAPAPVATNWTGCYVNAGVGYGLNNKDHFTNFGNVVFNRDETSGGRGWLGTVGGGCDYQFSPGNGWSNWVVGAFADYDLMDIRGSFDDLAAGATAKGSGSIGPEKESWAVAVGGRIGFLVTPQVLTYVNGGWTSTRFGGVVLPASLTWSGEAPAFSACGNTYNA